MKARVIFSSGGNYRVLSNSAIYKAKPMGIFRKTSTEIIVGDIVELVLGAGDNLNVITKLETRKNQFTRPKISNIDYAIIVTSLKEPDLNTFLLDKLITIFQFKRIEPILIFTKKDLVKEVNLEVNDYIKAGYKVIVTTKDNCKEVDIDKLHHWIKNSFSVITGQTGVGKSTFINIINPSFNLKTNEISKALGRGKHTTRHTEAFEVFPNTYIIDTPGFSDLSANALTKNQLAWNFFNFESLASKCKYNDCLHINEKDCNVKLHTSKERHSSYLKLQKQKDNS